MVIGDGGGSLLWLLVRAVVIFVAIGEGGGYFYSFGF